MFLGRRSLGIKHQRYASRSFILVVVGQIVEGVGAFVATLFFILALAQSTTAATDTLTTYFLSLYGIIIISDVITNIGLVFFTYDMQDSTGRTLLWSAFTLEILIDIIVVSLVVLEVQATAQQILSQTASFGDAFSALQVRFAALRLLLWIPAIPYAIAYYKARSRIDQLAVVHARSADPSSGSSSSIR
jgi:hypothetical protein